MRHHTSKPGRDFADLMNSGEADVPTAAAEPVFEVDGMPCPQSEFVEANADNPGVVAWAKTAKVGEWFPTVVDCRRAS
jgi:hypothetical protein